MTTLEKCIADFTVITGKEYDAENVVHKAVVDDMVMFRDNQADNLGVANITINGISESYMADYPQYILRQLSRLSCNVQFI